jgi:hypothetical protein
MDQSKRLVAKEKIELLGTSPETHYLARVPTVPKFLPLSLAQAKNGDKQSWK